MVFQESRKYIMLIIDLFYCAQLSDECTDDKIRTIREIWWYFRQSLGKYGDMSNDLKENGQLSINIIADYLKNHKWITNPHD